MLPAVAGFLVASHGSVEWALLLGTLLGLALIIASACVFNNYLDREIDKKMERTKKRALAAKTIPDFNALFFAGVLMLGGALVLAGFTNWLTFGVALAAEFMYVIVYGYFKRHSALGTLVGSIPGAAPPVVGYTAVANRLDGAALILFLILALWQMPHFYSIAIYRLKDYRQAKLPVLPIKYGYKMTKVQILLYIAAFTAVCGLLGILGYISANYLIIAIPLGLYWLWLGLKGWQVENVDRWARQMFGFSLVVLLAISTALSLDSFIR